MEQVLTNTEVQRLILLLAPAAALVLCFLWAKPTPRQATGALVSFFWQLPALYLLHCLARLFDWWHFNSPHSNFNGLPVDVWIGWAVWWGAAATFAAYRLRFVWIFAFLLFVDFVSMPQLYPLVELQSHWWQGALLGVALCLLPSLVIGKLTAADRMPRVRVLFHIIGWGGYIALLIPAAVLAYTGDSYYKKVLAIGWHDLPIIVFILWCLHIGIMATLEFGWLGRGTPIPFDPPKTVVTSGIYAYIANPMQLICTLYMVALAWLLETPSLLWIAVGFFIYDYVFSKDYNDFHIANAMPGTWQQFQNHVPNWYFRWRPYMPHQADFAMDDTQRWQRGMLGWFSNRRDVRALTVSVLASESNNCWARYRRQDGTCEYNWLALGRALEHINLFYAQLSWILRLFALAVGHGWLRVEGKRMSKSNEALAERPELLKQHDSVIVFDGECGFCAIWVMWLMRRDRARRLTFCTAQSEPGRAILRWRGIDPDNFNTMVFASGGRAWTKSAAVVEALRAAGGAGRGAVLLYGLPRALRDKLYDWVARHRYGLGFEQSACRLRRNYGHWLVR